MEGTSSLERQQIYGVHSIESANLQAVCQQHGSQDE